MKCPHCLQGIEYNQVPVKLGIDKYWEWHASFATCPLCRNGIIQIANANPRVIDRTGAAIKTPTTRMVFPKTFSRQPLSTEVPVQFAELYNEACVTLPDSERASAALSRRCLQQLLVKVAGAKTKRLVDQIQEVLDSGQLPSYISRDVDAIRAVGNFAAHPGKSTNTGEIIDVEPGEAEYSLDVLDALFDFYFVQPSVMAAKREALNRKLKDAGKPPLQEPAAPQKPDQPKA